MQCENGIVRSCLSLLLRSAGGADRQAGDQGGHLIADRVGGRNDPTNLDAQAANVNQKDQANVERNVANPVTKEFHDELSNKVIAAYKNVATSANKQQETQTTATSVKR